MTTLKRKFKVETENGLGLGAGRIQAKKRQKQKEVAPEEVIEVNSETDEAGPGPSPTSSRKIFNEQLTKDSERQASSRESAIVSTTSSVVTATIDLDGITCASSTSQVSQSFFHIF